MRLTILRIIDPDFSAALQKLGESPAMPISQRYWLAKSLSAIERELRDVEKVRVGLIKSHGKQDADGQWTVAGDELAMAIFQSEMGKLLQTEVEVPLPTGLKLDDMCPLTATQLAKVMDLLAEPQEEAPATMLPFPTPNLPVSP